MAYCPYDGRLARWPKHDPWFCTMRCAADQTVSSFSAGPDGTTHCATCGLEAGDQDCFNIKCADYLEPPAWVIEDRLAWKNFEDRLESDEEDN